jgi:hypothetical protein
MSEVLTIQVSQEDADAVARLFDSLKDDFGKSAQQAIVTTGYYVARAFSAKTRQSPKRRRLHKTTVGTPGLSELATRAGISPKQAVGWFGRYVERYSRGELVNRFIARDEDPEKSIVIKRSGLAKKSWLWMLPGIRSGSVEGQQVSVRRVGDAYNPGIVLHDKLPYATQALRSSVGEILSSGERKFVGDMKRMAERLAAKANA